MFFMGFPWILILESERCLVFFSFKLHGFSHPGSQQELLYLRYQTTHNFVTSSESPLCAVIFHKSDQTPLTSHHSSSVFSLMRRDYPITWSYLYYNYDVTRPIHNHGHKAKVETEVIHLDLTRFDARCF